MLAATLYLRQTGQLPPTLDSLVTAKIIDQIPLDSWSQSPFEYQRTELRLTRPSATNDDRSDPSCADWAYWILPEPKEAGK